MSNSSTYDSIIVGAGIAGTVLALQMHRAGKKVLLIDQPSLSSCSRIAGGIYNPVVFKKITLSWRATDIFPALENFYAEAEKLLEQNILFPVKMAKLFSSFHEQNEWMRKTADPVFGQFISEDEMGIVKDNPDIVNEFGSGTVKTAGWVNTELLIIATKKFYGMRNCFLEEAFDFSLLKTGEEFISYKNYKAKNIVFCEGHLISKNPYFSYIPFKPTKGEVVLVEVAGLNVKTILKKDIYIIPMFDDLYKLGSTYTWDNLNEETTDEAREEMLRGLEKMVNLKYIVKGQWAAVRPTVKDRKPVMGPHPVHKNILVFNGLGTKGVSLAPHFAGLMVQWMNGEEVYVKDVSVERFQKEFEG